MVFEVQVHENTYKRGMWAYHSVYRWYMATSPEHYLTHLCHIKTINSERFTDNAQFSHKIITKPTISHAKTIRAAISDCTKAIRNMGGNNGADEMQQLLQLTEKAVRKNTAITKSVKPAPYTNA